MAATVAVSRSQYQAVSFGGFRARLAKITPDTSYPTAGYVLAPKDFGLSEILGVIPVGLDNTVQTTGVVWQYNIQTGKLQAFWTGAVVSTILAEVTNATNLSAQIQHFIVFGV